MIHVIASVRLKAGRLPEYLEIVKENAVKVREEKGCIEYTPAVDFNSGLQSQILDEHGVTIIEKWESLEVLRDHLGSSHMLAYREKVRDMVEAVLLRILKEA